MKADTAEAGVGGVRSAPGATVAGPARTGGPVVRAEIDWDAVLPPRAATWRWRAGQRLKRVLDVALSVIGLLMLTPILLMVALLVRLSGPGPVIYRWDAVGTRGRRFVGYKFRTMVPEAEKLKQRFLKFNEMENGPVFKMREDPRITPIGRWLRRFSLDELPQLWNVVKGDMSLVGPRPPLPEEFVDFRWWQRGKLAVTPGITCLWQIHGRNEISDFNEWVALDLEYIRKWSLWLDLKILLRTLPEVVRGRGAY